METTWKPTAAGITAIAGGALAIIGGAIFVLVQAVFPWADMASEFGPYPTPFAPFMAWYPRLFVAIGVCYIVAGAVAIVGGVYAVRRRTWGLALAGSIAALLSAAPLGVASLVFLLLGRNEFPVPVGQTVGFETSQQLRSALQAERTAGEADMPDPGRTGEEAQVQRTWKPITAGILSIIAGVINFTHGALSLTLGGFVTFMAPAESAGLLHVVGIIAAVLMVLGATSIAGGVYALMRRLWGLALAGACCAVLCTIPLLFGIPAIVFLAKGKAEFARASDTDPKSRADAESS